MNLLDMEGLFVNIAAKPSKYHLVSLTELCPVV